jgi:hypothetical protein
MVTGNAMQCDKESMRLEGYEILNYSVSDAIHNGVQETNAARRVPNQTTGASRFPALTTRKEPCAPAVGKLSSPLFLL